jgi:hypothetical protein
MRKKKYDSRALRRLAEDTIDRIADGAEIFESEREKLVTSLVRQWVTYDGHAALFLGVQPLFFHLGETPLGNPRTDPKLGPRNWLEIVATDWNIDPDDLPEVADQLNCGQSAEVVNRDGIALRAWTNPAEGRCAVEALDPVPPPPHGAVADYRKIATRCIEDRCGDDLETEEIDALAASMAKQWQQFDGHASLFLGGGKQVIHCKLTEHAGGSDLTATKQPANLAGLLEAQGFSPEKVSSIIARINLGQTIECSDPRGVQFRLRHDPKQRRVVRERVGAASSLRRGQSILASCPQCSALLAPREDGEVPHVCPLCGHAITRP